MSLVWVFSLCACVNIPMFSSVPLEPLFTLGPGNQKQHKQNNSNNNNKMNSIHISMEQHCPGGLTLPTSDQDLQDGHRTNNTMRRVLITQRDREVGLPVHTFLLKALSVDRGNVIIVNLN